MLSESQASFAQRQRVAHLATADAGGQPHVVPICFVLLDGDFYFAIDRKPKRTTRLKRLRNIEENPAVALVIDRYDEDWSRLGWLMLQGVASLVESGPRHDAAVAALAEKYVQYRDMVLDDRPIVRIVPERASSWGDLDEER
ncbi:MAG: TIGR03668 family PPOX class F420-dependent oxidoreductase [Chloroflexi bacterium]|nr:TIGR03668 family PPOX class F420-dependent oxidoreductase [Chloroflexota bacterium]